MPAKTHILAHAVRLALPLGLTLVPGALYAQAANADADQDKSPISLDTVKVTGSLVRRVDVETASPVAVVDRQMIQQSGKQTLGDLLQSLPGIAGAATNPQVNNGGGDGASTISLRGLGEQRTLLLIDGRRILNNDVNAIPANMIERVEVLKVGASAVYGSDAIGGVVNFILRKNFEGGEFTANYGQASAGDGARHGGTFTFGKTWDRGSLVLGLDYNKQNEVSSADREYSKYAMYLSSGSVYRGGSSRTPNGYYKLPASSALNPGGCSVDSNQSIAVSGVGSYHCYSSSDAYNYQANNLLMTPQERVSGFVLGSFNLTDNLQAYVNAYHNHTMSHYSIAPLPFDAQQDGVTIAADNPYNPFGVEFGPNGYEYRSRFTSLGNREGFYDTSTDQDVLGLKGTFGDSSWAWDANYNYGHYKQRSWSHGYVDYAALQDAINNGEINIFDQSAAADWLGSHESIPRYSTTTIKRQVEASANGSLWDLPAGTMQLAVGALYRKESLNYTVSSNAVMADDQTCAISSEACSSPMNGGFNVKEAYAQLYIPLLEQSSPIGALSVTLSDRLSDYSSVDSTNNSGSFQMEWRPIHDLLVRGTVSQVFRAPTLNDLYAGPGANAPTFTDPCIGYSGSGHENACEGVSAGWKGSGLSQTDAVTSGARYIGYDLKPEKGDSYDYGIVYSPSFVPGLSFNLDWWKVKLDDLIQEISAQTVADLCYNDNNSPYCSYIHRYPSGSVSAGNIDNIQTPVVNIGKLDTQGIDFGANYVLPDTAWGRFTFALDSTYLQRYDIDTGDTVIHMAGKYNSSYGNYTRWRARGQIGWKLGEWDATLTSRWIGKIQVGSTDESQNMSADGVDKGVVLNYGSYMYHSLQVGYDMTDANLRFELGVDNLTNKQPPVLYQNNVLNANTDVSTYDTIGRYYWMRATYRF